MQSAFYQEYIKSPEWHCRTMQVHHVTYRNLGHEDVMKDLCTVCGSCHKKLHNYYDRERGD